MLKAIRSQYLASLGMLEKAVEACPDELWFATNYRNPGWHIAHHALAWTHYYLQATSEASTRPADPPTPPARAQVLEQAAQCRREVDARLPATDLAGPSGFHWLPFDKLELQFYNIRHLQHHVGQLIDRLTGAGISVKWIRAGE